MNGVLRSMLEGVIDYAGLFPPAKLALPEAVSEYLGATHGDDKWIVDRFACPVGKLKDLAIELAEHPDEPFVPVSVIGSSHPDHKHWKSGLEHDAAEMTRFHQAAENHAEIQAYEARVPDHRHLAEYLGDIRSFANIDLFLELPWGPEMPDSISALAESDGVFAKARTGGPDVAAFPPAADLAGFLQRCAQLDVAFKLTAGLHHPLPNRDPHTGATMHGFLNVLVATALSLADDLSLRELQEVLDETDPKAFAFKREYLTWRDHRANLEDVENARTLFFSFGSCSIREPLEGLGAIGLLEKAGR